MSEMNEEMTLDDPLQGEPQHAAQLGSIPPPGRGVERDTQPMAGRLRPRDDGGSEPGKVASPRTDEEPQVAANHSLHRADKHDKEKTRTTIPSARTRQESGTQIAGGSLTGRVRGNKGKEPVTEKSSELQLASGQQGGVQPKIASVMSSPISTFDIEGHRKENRETTQARLDNIQDNRDAAGRMTEEEEVKGGEQTGAGVTHSHTPLPSGPRARSPPPLRGTYRPERHRIYRQLLPETNSSEPTNIADGYASEDDAVKDWFACTLMNNLDRSSTIEDTVKAIKADKNA